MFGWLKVKRRGIVFIKTEYLIYLFRYYIIGEQPDANVSPLQKKIIENGGKKIGWRTL